MDVGGQLHLPATLPLEKNFPLNLLGVRLSGLHNQSGHHKGEENLFSLFGIEL
jgi:hypothetical protein